MVALIYSPSKNAMQSGQASLDKWVLRYEPSQPKMIEPLMHYVASADMQSQVVLRFATKEAAVAYAVKRGLPYRIIEPKPLRRRRVAYSDNFSTNRVLPWTH